MRAAYPFIVVLHADIAAHGDLPLVLTHAMQRASGRLMPAIRHAGQPFLIALAAMFSISNGVLRHCLGSAAAYRDEITRGIDWLFTGV